MMARIAEDYYQSRISMERYIDLDDGKIFVDTYGEESLFPLVLLHGNSEDSSYFIHQIEYFSDKYFVIAIDSRGHGKSSYNGEKLTIDKLASDVINVLDIMGIKSANFLGFSDGGNVLLSIALKKPELINKMVLNGANLKPSGVNFWVNVKIYCKYFMLKLKSMFNEDYLKETAVWKLMINEPKFQYSQIEKIINDTLVLVGTKDMIKARHSKKIADAIKTARLVEIEGDHFIASNEPLAFNNTVEEFLKNS